MEIMLYGSSALSIMKPFNTEQKTKIVEFYLKHGSAVLTQRQYRRHFKVREAPTIKTIQRLTEKFLAEGFIRNQNAGNSGRKKKHLAARRPYGRSQSRLVRRRKCRCGASRLGSVSASPPLTGFSRRISPYLPLS